MDTKKDVKTTIGGLLAALPQLAAIITPIFGMTVPAEVTSGITAIGLAILGYFAVDKK